MCISGLRALGHQGHGHQISQMPAMLCRESPECERGCEEARRAQAWIDNLSCSGDCGHRHIPGKPCSIPHSCGRLARQPRSLCRHLQWVRLGPTPPISEPVADSHTVQTTSDKPVLETQVKPAKLCQGCQALSENALPIRTHQPDKQLPLTTMTNAYCAPCSNGMPSSIQWSPLSSLSWKACQASTSLSFRRGMASPCQTCSRGMRSLAPAYCSGSRATSPSTPSSSSQDLSPVGWSYGQAKNAHPASSGAVLP